MRNVRARSDQSFQLSSVNNGATDRLTEEERIKENTNVKVVLKSTTGHTLLASYNEPGSFTGDFLFDLPLFCFI